MLGGARLRACSRALLRCASLSRRVKTRCDGGSDKAGHQASVQVLCSYFPGRLHSLLKNSLRAVRVELAFRPASKAVLFRASERALAREEAALCEGPLLADL